MQLGAINSVNFGNNGYYSDMTRNDIEIAERLANIMREYDNSDLFMSKTVDEEGEPAVKKGVLGTVASVIIGGIGIFALAKKGEKIAKSVADTVTKTKPAKAVATFIQNSAITKKAQNVLSGLNDKIAEHAKIAGAKDFIVNGAKKIGAGNIVAGGTAIGSMAYVSKSDSNQNGIPDIAEKGINAYKGAIQNLDLVKEIVDMVA